MTLHEQLASSACTIPAGLIEVNEQEFFTRLHADHRDIMPTTENRSSTNWETRGREVVGWCSAGWANPGDSKIWAWRN